MEATFLLLRHITDLGVQIAADGIWIAVPLALLAAFGWRMTVKASARLGCRIWWAAIVITLTLPFFLNLVPPPLSSWPDLSTFKDPSAMSTSALPAVEKTAEPKIMPLPTAPLVESHVSPRPQSREAISLPPEPAEPVTWQSIAVGLAPFAAVWLWLLVSSALLVRLLLGLRSMYRLKDSAEPIDLNAYPAIKQTVTSTHLRQAPIVAASDCIGTPVAAGLGQPMVIIPRDILADFNEHEIDMIVRHEITHLERRDDWLVLIQRLIQSVLCFNPVLHWMARRLDLAREMACDERVVDQYHSARDYAHCLARLATLPRARTPLLATGALTGRKHIIRRFDQLLALSRRGRRPMVRVAFATILMLVVTAATVRVAPVVDIPVHSVTFDQVRALWANARQAEKNEAARQSYERHLERKLEAESAQAASEQKEREKEEKAREDYLRAVEAEAHSHSQSSVATGSGTSADANAIGIGNSNSASAAQATSDDEVKAGGIVRKTKAWAKGIVDGLSRGASVISDGSGNTTYSWSDGRHKLQVRTRGEIRIADDDRSIESISRRGYFDIYESTGHSERELEIRPDADGKLQYSYYVDGRSQDFDDNGKEWFADVLLTVVRNSGWNAADRVKRIYKNKGTKGVLDEIDLIEGSYAKRIYYQALFDVADLTTDDYKRILKQAETEIDSDYEKAELLISLSDNIKHNADLLPLFVDAVATIDSDYETRRVLSTISFDHQTDPKVLAAVLQIADRMDSDYEKAELLISLSKLMDNDPELQVAYVQSLTSMESDYEKRRVLTALIRSGQVDQKAVDKILDISKSIDSDYEKAELLTDLGNLTKDDPKLQGRVMEAVATIDSDYESRRVIQSWSIDCTKNRDLLGPLLNSAENIDGDYDSAELLTEISRCLNEDMGTFQRFLDISDNISSDYDHARVLNAVISGYQGEFSDDQLKALILSARKISSDYDKARVLEELIQFCRGKGELENQLADAIDTITSDYEADGLLAKLYRGSRRRSVH